MINIRGERPVLTGSCVDIRVTADLWVYLAVGLLGASSPVLVELIKQAGRKKKSAITLDRPEDPE